MITTKEIIEKLPNNSDFREWFLDNAKVLTKDINSFFTKFKGDEITIESTKPLLSWSIVIPKEHKMNLLNTLARLKGQKVLASYGIKNKDFNKVITEAIKENKDIEASDEVKSYLKVNFSEFYKELFDTLSNYETLGTKSVEPIAKIITLKLGAEKGRTVKFCEEFKAYLIKLLKNVIDSINNTMKNYEKPITASSESVEDILRSMQKELVEKAKSFCLNIESAFSVNDKIIYGEVALTSNNSGYILSFKWSKDVINTNLIECKKDLCHDLNNNTFSIRDFEGVKAELLKYLNTAKVEFNSNKVTNAEKTTLKEVDCSDVFDICKVIVNGDFPNDLKAKANLYLSLFSVKDVNTQYMTTLADSIISKYKTLSGIKVTFKNPILESLKNFLGKFNFDDYLNKTDDNGNEILVCFKDDINFTFYLRYLIGGTVIMCHANCEVCENDSDYMVQVSDETSTMTEIECWVKSVLPEFSVTASKKKTKWTRAEIVKFAKKNNATEITSFEEYKKINNKLYLENIGYAKDINGNCIGRLWQDKKNKQYYYCTNMGTLMMI